MNNHSSPGFRDKYIAIARLYKVKESALRWYVKHAEAYIAEAEEVPFAEHEAVHLETYLCDKGRNPGIKRWQFLQIVQALEILFVELVQTPWANDYAWREWNTTAQTLPDDHATLSRAYSPLVDNNTDETAGENLSLSRKVVHMFPQQVKALITQIKVRHYSIRTEQAYLGWFCRFIAHNGMQDPNELGERHIGDFIEQLVTRRNVSAGCFCPVAWRANIRMPKRSCGGSIFSRLRACRWIHGRDRCVAIISMKTVCKNRLREQRKHRG